MIRALFTVLNMQWLTTKKLYKGQGIELILTHHRHCDLESHLDVYNTKMSKNISEHAQSDHTRLQLVPII